MAGGGHPVIADQAAQAVAAAVILPQRPGRLVVGVAIGVEGATGGKQQPLAIMRDGQIGNIDQGIGAIEARRQIALGGRGGQPLTQQQAGPRGKGLRAHQIVGHQSLGVIEGQWPFDIGQRVIDHHRIGAL